MIVTAKIEIYNKKNGSQWHSYIPFEVRHRLSKLNNIKLTLIDIQNENYLGEQDRNRFVDIFIKY